VTKPSTCMYQIYFAMHNNLFKILKYLHFIWKKKTDILTPIFFMGWLVSYLCLFVHNNVQRVLTIWVTWWVSYKRQELFTLREHLGFMICEFLIFLDFCIECFCVLFILIMRLVFPMLPLSLDWPFLIALSIV
jgi:hypothetical protein